MALTFSTFLLRPAFDDLASSKYILPGTSSDEENIKLKHDRSTTPTEYRI